MYCVYIHLCRMTGKIYVGQTKDTVQRWRMNGLNYKGKFKEAINKYGWENFDHFVVEDGLTKQEAYALEAKLIKKFNTVKRGYNTEPGTEKPLTAYNPDTEEILRFRSRQETARYFADKTGNLIKSEYSQIKNTLDNKKGRYRYKGYFLFDGKLSKTAARSNALNMSEINKNRGDAVQVRVIFPDGKEKLCLSGIEAAEEAGCSYSAYKTAVKNNKPVNGITFIKLSENKTPIRARKNGTEIFFDSQREFARYVNASSSNVSNALKKPEKRTVKGWSLSYV